VHRLLTSCSAGCQLDSNSIDALSHGRWGAVYSSGRRAPRPHLCPATEFFSAARAWKSGRIR